MMKTKLKFGSSGEHRRIRIEQGSRRRFFDGLERLFAESETENLPPPPMEFDLYCVCGTGRVSALNATPSLRDRKCTMRLEGSMQLNGRDKRGRPDFNA